MTRTTARRLAVQLSFAQSQGSDLKPADFFAEDYFEALPSDDKVFSEIPDDEQMAYISQIVNGVSEHQNEFDEIISTYSKGWKISRISKTALAIMRCALYEIQYLDDVPASVAINEAVELCKEYDEAETVSFVNGILGSFMRAKENN